MSALSEKARENARNKVQRLVRADPYARTDASGYRPDGAMDADVAMGMRPMSRRTYKRGGRIGGAVATPRADRKKRASGGAASLTPNNLINRNVKEANAERGGLTHEGGLKHGGRAHKLVGGALSPQQRTGLQQRATIPAHPAMRPMMRKEGGKVHADAAEDRKLIHKEMHKSGCGCAKCAGGRVGHASGGKSEYGANRGLAQAASSPTKPAPRWAASAMKSAASQGVNPYNSQPAQTHAYRQLLAQRAGRKEGGRTKEKWIRGAIEHPGAFSAKAKKAGMSTSAYASKVTKPSSHASEKTKEQAGLAKTLGHLRPHARGGPAINDGTRPTGGRLARKGGGRAKGKTNINIVIAPQGAGAQRPPIPPMAAGVPPGGPVGLHQGAPPPMPPQAPSGAMPPQPMMRKAGGRTNAGFSGQLVKPGAYPISTGGGGGLARLEKAERAARQ
jgi:hypothetical protein